MLARTRRVRTLTLTLAAVVLLGACDVSTLPRENLWCEAPIEDATCRQVGELAYAGVEVDRRAVGDVREVIVTEVGNCGRLGRSLMDPRLEDPAIEACWEVQMAWQRGRGTWVVVRDRRGNLRVLN